MIKYTIREDDITILVPGPEALVNYLNETAESPSADSASFMLDYAKRSVLYRNIDIRATDFNSFVEDLLLHGDVSIVT